MRHRLLGSLRWPVVAGCAALACQIVFGWRIGPGVLVLSATHGVHTGDSLALLPTLLGAVLASTGRARGGYALRSRTASTPMSMMLTAATVTPQPGWPTAPSAAPVSAKSAV